MLNWDSLRSDIDIRHSFEELCCQLARYESIPDGSKFIRKGTPDAGVECFWILPNDSEWAWQAKWFRTAPTSQQWTQIDKSVKKALEKHPNLTKYTICLPTDRSDPRRKGEKSSLDKWNNYVCTWKKIKNIDFEYWGTSEIEDKLSKEQHAGKRKYFFDQKFLSHKWFEQQLKVANATAGPRYSPKLNIKLSIAKPFEVLGRTQDFFDYMKRISREIRKDFEYGQNASSRKEAKEEFVSLSSKIDSITKILIEAENLEQKHIEFNKINKDSKLAKKLTQDIIEKLEKKARVNGKGKKKYESIEVFNEEKYHLRKLQQRLQKISQQTTSNLFLVANTGALLLSGNAGNGKTHLFCDVANERFKKHRYGVLLDGGHFTDSNPKKQIMDELGLNCTFNEFVGALNTVGQINNAKTFIMIDALNEGSGQKIWPKYLPELLEIFSEYHWVGIALSVRTSYESLIIPKNIESSKLSKFIHTGFEDKTEEATKKFFENNGIERPSVPLLVPEFSNPQFLLILCKALKNKGLSKIPKGLKGITSVYDFFVSTVNEKLSTIDLLDYPCDKKIVQKAVIILAEKMSIKNTRHLNYDDADESLNMIYPSHIQSKSLLHHMVSEGILHKDQIRTEEGTFESTIQFSYERLGDNLIVQNQLRKIKTKKDIPKLFRSNGAFSKYFKDNLSLQQHKGIVDAISIQLPEKFSKELIEIIPKFLKSSVILESFIDSFMWRHPNSIKESSLSQIEKVIIRKKQYLESFFKMILTISTDPEIALNGKYLHKYLLGLELGDRDYIWSTFLHYNYSQEDSIVSRYIDWAWNSDKSLLNTESIYLASLTLSWFFTSSNRFVRDRATKALVSLLSNNIELFEKLLQKFAKCNDPYVIERLFCAAYGCSMKSNNKTELKKLAQYTYAAIFKKGIPPTNILLRDYAKSIIDYVLYKGIELDINYKKIEPPYNSEWIKSFPTENTIKKLEKKHEGTPQLDNGVCRISQSLGYMGDFYRYILGGNSEAFEWSAVPLLNQHQSRETVFNKFEKTITKLQKIPWENYYMINSEMDKFRNIKEEDRKKTFGFTFDDDEFDERIVIGCEKYLRQTLNSKQLKTFEQNIIPYVNLSFHQKPAEKYIDLDSYARWINKKVFDLGWTKKRFGEYDININRNRNSETNNDTERMGKKYQWIAYHELLSRVCDNFEFIEENFNQRKFRKYVAPWQLIDGRDIDPSLLISETFSSSYDKPYSSWWFPFNYDDWYSKKDVVEWLKNHSDLPPFKSMLEVKKPDTQVKWLVLGGYFSLQQKISPDKDPDNTESRNIFFNFESCISKKSDIVKLYNWGKKQRLQGQFPKFEYTTSVFLGEYYWAKSVQHVMNTEDSFRTKREGDDLKKILAKVHVPMYQYRHENGGYDCSTDNEISIFLPNKLLVDKMNLVNKNDGTFVDTNDEIVAYDPSILEKGPSVLLIQKDKFIEFLKDNDYGIIWHVIGQKRVLGGFSNMVNWKGCLEIQGVSKITNDEIKSKFNMKFIDRKMADKRNEDRKTK